MVEAMNNTQTEANKIGFDGLGNRLKAARNTAGLTQEALARAIDVSWMTIHRWEYGQRSVPRAKAIQLAAVVGRTYEDLFVPELAG